MSTPTSHHSMSLSMIRNSSCSSRWLASCCCCCFRGSGFSKAKKVVISRTHRGFGARTKIHSLGSSSAAASLLITTTTAAWKSKSPRFPYTSATTTTTTTLTTARGTKNSFSTASVAAVNGEEQQQQLLQHRQEGDSSNDNHGVHDFPIYIDPNNMNSNNNVEQYASLRQASYPSVLLSSSQSSQLSSVAMFIDAQNVSSASFPLILERLQQQHSHGRQHYQNHHHDQQPSPTPAKTTTTTVSTPAVSACCSVQRIYADAGLLQSSGWKTTVAQYGLHNPHPQLRARNVDSLLVMDVMETLYIRPHVSTFVLLTADADFTPLVIKLREEGKYVVGYGPKKSTASELATACHDYTYVEDLFQEDRQKKKKIEQQRQQEEVEKAKLQQQQQEAKEEQQRKEQEQADREEAKNQSMNLAPHAMMMDYLQTAWRKWTAFVFRSADSTTPIIIREESNSKKKDSNGGHDIGKDQNDDNKTSNKAGSLSSVPQPLSKGLIEKLHEKVAEHQTKSSGWTNISNLSKVVDFKSLGYKNLTHVFSSLPNEFELLQKPSNTSVKSKKC